MKKIFCNFVFAIAAIFLFSLNVAADDATVVINGDVQNYDVPPQIVGGRLMVPMRGIFEALGAAIDWSAQDQIVTALTENALVMLQIGEPTAFVNGELKPLDQPATIVGGRTLVPLRFVAEALGADVDWDAATRTATITSRAFFAELPDIDFEAWALGASAIFAANNGFDPYLLGMTREKETVANILKNSWNIDSRAGLIATISETTDGGHNSNFAGEYQELSELSDSEFEFFLTILDESDEKFIAEMIHELGDKWGEKQLKAWDWFRMIHLAGWGYALDFVTQNESFELMLPAIERLRATFSSWDEANQNYLDGYAWWSRTDRALADTEYARLVKVFDELKTRADDKNLFDPNVWG
ncbi:MAG: stalk domain-containing protein [Defluviitaleaceae bacterium]|nr:stalk domain-containing protein [Defluviitaleaceae bacterium]